MVWLRDSDVNENERILNTGKRRVRAKADCVSDKTPVCLCHTWSGVFSPLLCHGDANRKRSANVTLASPPTSTLAHFCLIRMLKMNGGGQ